MRRALLLLIVLALSAVECRSQITLGEYARRRAALAGALGDGVFVARGAVAPVQDYNAFFQSAGFLYLPVTARRERPW